MNLKHYMDPLSRSRFLVGSSISLALIAGCAGQSGQEGEGTSPTATPTQTPTSSPTSTPTATPTPTTTQQDEQGHGMETPTEPSDQAEVAMITRDSSHHFEPHVVWITPSSTVTWTLESGTHTTTAYHPGNEKPLRVPEGTAAWDSGVLAAQGDTFEHSFDTEGIYDYFCIPHEATGMLGSVIVGRPEPRGQPALEPPQQDLPQGTQQKITDLNETVTNILGKR